MKQLLRTLMAFCVIALISPGNAEYFDAEFEGPILETNYLVPGKPQKFKDRVTFNLVSNGTCTITFSDGGQFSGTWYEEFRYVWLQFQQGGPLNSGRLKLSGKPGQEKKLSGTMTSVFNGNVGFYEYKVNLKRVAP